MRLWYNNTHMKYNYQEGFISLVVVFILVAFAYIIGGGVVQNETAQNQANALASLSAQENALNQ